MIIVLFSPQTEEGNEAEHDFQGRVLWHHRLYYRGLCFPFTRH